jgi:hypothetical protein
VLDLQSSGQAKPLAGNMRGGADSSRSKIELSRSGFGGGYKLGDGVEVLARRGDEDARLRAEHRYGYEVMEFVVGQGAVQNDRRAHRGRAQQQHIAVRLRPHHRGDPDNPAAAGTILDHKCLADLLSDLIEHKPRHNVIGAAGGERAHHQDWARRPILCGSRAASAEHGQQASRQEKRRSQIHAPGILI